jgi:hypothetical protein
MRSTAIRDIRVRIASSASAQYFGRIVSATPQWSSQTFVFTAGVGDSDAVLELEPRSCRGNHLVRRRLVPSGGVLDSEPSMPLFAIRDGG